MTLRAHRHLSTALRRLESGQNKKAVLKAIKASVEELKDPFAGEIDDFLAEKASRQNEAEPEIPENSDSEPNEELRDETPAITEEHPQEQSEEKLDDETPQEALPEDNAPKETPQEALDDKLGDTMDESAEDKVEELEDKVEDLQEQQEDIEDDISETMSDPDDENHTEDIEPELNTDIEAQANKKLLEIARTARERGYHRLAAKFIKATAHGPIEVLNNLLMLQFQQKDIASNYMYLLDETQKAEVIQHLISEKDRIDILQSTIVNLGGTPTTQRYPVPPINPQTGQAVIDLNKELEKQGVAEYLAAAETLEGLVEYASIKSWLEQQALKEAEDIQDFKS